MSNQLNTCSTLAKKLRINPSCNRKYFFNKKNQCRHKLQSFSLSVPSQEEYLHKALSLHPSSCTAQFNDRARIWWACRKNWDMWQFEAHDQLENEWSLQPTTRHGGSSIYCCRYKSRCSNWGPCWRWWFKNFNQWWSNIVRDNNQKMLQLLKAEWTSWRHIRRIKHHVAVQIQCWLRWQMISNVLHFGRNLQK